MSLDKIARSVDWLKENLNDPNVVVVDGSWHLPPEKRDPKAEYETAHIPGAVFFDLENQADKSQNLGHMMPSAEQFGSAMGELGISEKNTIIVYDCAGLFSAARVWFMLREFGATETYLLDGGFPAWQRAGHEIESGVTSRNKTTFNATMKPGRIIDIEDILAKLGDDDAPLILDARGPGRFHGREPEPHAGVKSGHIPGAVNLPYSALLDDDSKFKSSEELQEIISAAGYDPSKPAIASCGSGITACVVLAALTSLGHTNIPLYDGSWSEWGARDDTPAETE